MIIEIGIDEKKQWNEIVRSFPRYDVFYLYEYVFAFMSENKSNGEPILLLYEKDSDRAINVVFKRDISLDEHLEGKVKEKQYYDLITPYGYGGFMGDIQDYDLLNQEYTDYCREKGYVCEFVRFELFSDYYAHYDGVTESRTHNVVRSLEAPLDEIWMDFKQKVRKNVKRANTYNLEKLSSKIPESILMIFLESTMEPWIAAMRKLSIISQKDFSRNLNQMKENIMYFHVVHEGNIISTELVIYGAENAYSYLGGTNREFFDMRPNDFLKYEIIKWAKEKGLRNFVLGGGYGSDDGIFQYKTCLAPHGIKDFYIGRKVLDVSAYDELCHLRER